MISSVNCSFLLCEPAILELKLKSIQAISEDGVVFFGVSTYYFYDVEIVFYLVYLNVVSVWVWSYEFVLDFNCWTVTNVPAQSADKHRPLCRDFWRGTGAKLISPSARRPLREISESIVDCMSVVREKPPLFKSRIPVRKQSSLVRVISKMSSCVGFGSVLSLSRSVSLRSTCTDDCSRF